VPNPTEPAASESAPGHSFEGRPLGRVLDPGRLQALDATGPVDGPGLEGLDRLTRPFEEYLPLEVE
jgi:hypothetical protein